MDSELDLNDEVQKLHVIATVPHLYHHIVDVNAVGTILGLLSHENSGKLLMYVILILQSKYSALLFENNFHNHEQIAFIYSFQTSNIIFV